MKPSRNMKGRKRLASTVLDAEPGEVGSDMVPRKKINVGATHESDTESTIASDAEYEAAAQELEDSSSVANVTEPLQMSGEGEAPSDIGVEQSIGLELPANTQGSTQPNQEVPRTGAAEALMHSAPNQIDKEVSHIQIVEASNQPVIDAPTSARKTQADTVDGKIVVKANELATVSETDDKSAIDGQSSRTVISVPEVTPFERIAHERRATLNSLKVIRRAIDVKQRGGYGSDRIPTTDIVNLFRNNPKALEHIVAALFSKSHETLTNLALADPSRYEYNVQFNKIVTKRELYPHSFFLVGVTTLSQLTAGEKARQICIAPVRGFWQRSVAVLSAIFGMQKPQLRFATFQEGINISTRIRSENTRPTNYAARGRRPVTGKYHGEAIHSWDADIPMYDGRAGFKIKQYQKLPVMQEELQNGDVVLVIFTVNLWGPVVDGRPTFNLQVVIKLHDAAMDRDSRAPKAPLPAYLYKLSDFGVSGKEQEAGSDAFSDNEDDA
ncbi:hypothetical protein BDZ89DRAFT_1140931 [Hymenopellis radicata]|nr:hypothetical protein BDZ89DRAFT_1140931 [Hymenopellis radicata]